MTSGSSLIHKLTALNEIADTLNQATDVKKALQEALAHLVELMDLETGWIFLRDDSAKNRWFGRGYTLAAHCNLPPAMALDKPRAWKGDCRCQSLCNEGELTRSYNEVRCSRLANAGGQRRGLVVHASTALYSGDRVLGILNVAAPDWSAFSEEALAVLTNAGSQMGIALERARLFDMLKEQRITEQAALLDMSSQLLSRLDVDDLMSYLVEEVQRLLDVDACTLLLPDEESEELAFRAASGWQVNPVQAERRAPADARSGPGLAMLNQQPLFIKDLKHNQTVPWMPSWLLAEGFRGHAVMPLIAEGHSIGALVINTREPRQFTEDEIRFLRLLANQAAITIEKARLHREALKQQRMVQELSVAQQIQFSLLPKSSPTVSGWEFAAAYRPARMVGGDIYDFFELPGKQDQWGIVIADVADKGVPSALYMALCRTVIRSTALSGRSPASTLMRANELILKDSQSDLFLSAFYAKLDTQEHRMIYSNAGHNPPLWLESGTGEFKELSTRGIVLGVLEGIELQEQRIDVAPGDVLVFYTDGVTEAIDDVLEEFGTTRLKQVVEANADQSATQITRAVVRAVDDFAEDTSQFDDLTLVTVKRCPEQEDASTGTG